MGDQGAQAEAGRDGWVWNGFGMCFPAFLGWVKGIVLDQTGEVPGEPLGRNRSRGHCVV